MTATTWETDTSLAARRFKVDKFHVSDIEEASSSATDSAESNGSDISSAPSPGVDTNPSLQKAVQSLPRIETGLAELFSENVIAKLWRVAVREINKENPPTAYPEYILSTGPNANLYTMREAQFWTCGFFPGGLYTLLERSMKYPQHFPIPAAHRSKFHQHLLALSQAWTVPIRAMETRTDTHDLGFIIQPALRLDWELTSNIESLNSIVTAAHSLASRYSETVGAIRSWNAAVNKRYSFTDMENDFLVIVDSMCNLDLLYFAGHQTDNQELINIATTHAHTVLRAIVRDDWSTYHLLNFSAKTGAIKNRLTNQGYADSSTWSRGQSWAILGFTQTYTWTHDPVFLDAAINLANYFLQRLAAAEAAAKVTYPYVPLWDFDAPPTPTRNRSGVLRDTSAGMIAANGMLLLHQILVSEGRREEGARFLEAVLRIVRETVDMALGEKAAFERVEEGGEGFPKVRPEKPGCGFDGILRHATANNNKDTYMRYADHGLVYADYYFLELGNKLLRMGLL